MGSLRVRHDWKWKRKWQSTPVFLPRKSHRQRSLVGYSPWACKKEDMTEQLSLSTKILTKHKWNNVVCRYIEFVIIVLVGSVAQLCPNLCKPMDCSPPGSSVHGISQARILEWVAISFSRGSSWPRNWTQVSGIAGRFFTDWASRESLVSVVSSSLDARSCPTLVTPWTVAHQAPMSMGLFRQECWSGLPFPPPGDLPAYYFSINLL